MARPKPPFRILIATDGSAVAREAMRVAARFPWPADVKVRAIVARDVQRVSRRSNVSQALNRSAEAVARSAALTLKKHWPDATVQVCEGSPIDAIITEATRMRARVIVVGWRGHGVMRRLLVGSVSRGVVRRARTAVLVVRRQRKTMQRIVIGLDESAHARHALELVAALAVPPGGHVTVLRAIERLTVPSPVHLTPDTRAIVVSEVDRINQTRRVKASKATGSAVAKLVARGWAADAKVTAGDPLWDLLAEVDRSRADLLVIGARGVSGLTRLLLGSVAEGALNRSAVPVLIVR